MKPSRDSDVTETKTAFKRVGAVRFAAALSIDEVERLRLGLKADLAGRPGKRLTGIPGLSSLLTDGSPAAIAANLSSASVTPVRAVAFDKTQDSNWAVAWHQDRTIVVRQIAEVDGFGPWSTKDGLQHVAPPFEVLERMITLRIHLDDCGDDNAPLDVATGSHRLGRVPADEAAATAMSMPSLTCLADAGDIWAYSTPILHRSSRSAGLRRRRVLQIDYSPDTLPPPLEWLGVA
jgi:hypothetical protein